jgi:hypothetical protein
MAATIVIRGCTSENAGTEATITALMFRANDSVEVDKNNPITIPAAGQVYSYEKWIRWMCTVAPDTQCTNFKFWGANSIPDTGLTVYDGTTDTGVTPVTTQSAVATTQQDTNHYSSATALAIAGTLTTENDETDYLVLQLKVADTAGQGDIPQQTFNFSYDEN